MNGKQLSTQYKERFSDYRQWDQLPHAEQFLLFPENLGEHLSIDETCLSSGEQYKPFRYANGDTRKQLLARAKFILTKHQSKWTESQRWRADIIFEFYPELQKAYELAMELTDIYNAKSHINAARLKLARWFNKVEQLGTDAFCTVIDTFKNHYETVLNFFINRATNAGAEAFNAKVKAFRAQFRGVTDIPFFLFRLMKICA